jgi:hypothetical protein
MATATATATTAATTPAAAAAAAAAPPPTCPPPVGNSAYNETPLQRLTREARPCLLTPKAFFVSWQGVLVLAYRGFPPQLAALKAGLTAAHAAAGGLPNESPGSRWPKTSLGALRDGRRLTPEQLAALLRACREVSEVFETEAAAADAAAAAAATTTTTSIEVRELSVITYECRSLERLISRARLPLQGGAGGRGNDAAAADADAAPPSAEEAARVATVLSEADDANYWFHASRDGGREAHYRAPAPGVTLVHELGLGASSEQQGTRQRLLDAVRRFRERVDAALPGMYVWFDDASLHVTVRAIIA